MKSEKDEFIDHMTYIFSAPIIQHPMWPIPDKIKDEATLYRLAEVQTIKNKMATGWEVMGYLSTQSLVGPLDHHWYQIYMYLFRKYMPEQAKMIDIEEIELGIMEQQMLERIQRWMFKQQCDHIKVKIKESEAKKQQTLNIVFEEVKA